MLSDQLTERMERAAEGPTFVPDFPQILATARRRRRDRRAAVLGGGAAAVALCGVIAFAAAGGLGHDRPSHGLGTAAGSPLPVTVTSRSLPKLGQTCEVLTFTETGAHMYAACEQVFRRDVFPTGYVQIDAFRLMRVRNGAAPTFIVDGDVAGSGRVEVTDETGRQVPATVLAPLPGYPVSVFYADLGPGEHRPIDVTLTRDNGDTSVYTVAPDATSAPPSPN
jgi:hypothetical protein